MLRAVPVAVLFVAILAGCTTPPAVDDLPVHEDPVPTALASSLHPLGTHTVEPSIGVTSSGAIFVIAAEKVLRSTDNDTTWEVVHDYAKTSGTGLPKVPFTLDPWLWVDPITDRIYVDHLTIACTTITWSDDDGDSWAAESPIACGTPVTDFQKLVTGPPGPESNPLAGVLWPTVAYLCYNKPVWDPTGNVPAGRYGLACAASYDGGLTWQNEQVLAQMVEVAGQVVVEGCGGGAWIPAVAPDGTVVVRAQPDCMFRSRDSGMTWEQVGTGPSFSGTIFDFDDNGTLYALSAWWDPPLRISVSRDQGETWETPYVIQPPGTHASAFPTLQAGGRGQLFVPLWSTAENLTTSIDAGERTRWHAWLVHVTDADTPATAVDSVQATPDDAPMFVGNPTRGMSQWFPGDFVTATIGPDGAGYVVFPDSCNEGCEGNRNATVDDLQPLGTVVRLDVDLRGTPAAATDAQAARQPS